MNDDVPILTKEESAARERSLADDLCQLAEEARVLAAAELAYNKSRVAFTGHAVKGIAISGALAAALVFFALMALTVGLVIALTPQLTALGATGAVFAGFLLAALICGRIASARWKRMAATLTERGRGE